MFKPSGEYSESRPFKIFVSLLDKWEIGATLTDILVYDAFKAIKQFIDSDTDSGEDVHNFPLLNRLPLIYHLFPDDDDRKHAL
jgi:hypothetical protein